MWKVVPYITCSRYSLFFKRRTSSEMRISDLSADVFSSDLHDRFLPVADPQRQGSEAGPGQGPARPEALGKACHAQYRQSAELWCSDHRIEARRKAGPGDGPTRSEERRVGKECVSPCISRWTP